MKKNKKNNFFHYPCLITTAHNHRKYRAYWDVSKMEDIVMDGVVLMHLFIHMFPFIE